MVGFAYVLLDELAGSLALCVAGRLGDDEDLLRFSVEYLSGRGDGVC